MPENSMKEIGKVVDFFSKASAIVIELSAPIRTGDTIYIKGHTTDFHQVVESMQIDHNAVQEAQAGQAIGLKVAQRCRKHDIVYKIEG